MISDLMSSSATTKTLLFLTIVELYNPIYTFAHELKNQFNLTQDVIDGLCDNQMQHSRLSYDQAMRVGERLRAISATYGISNDDLFHLEHRMYQPIPTMIKFAFFLRTGMYVLS